MDVFLSVFIKLYIYYLIHKNEKIETNVIHIVLYNNKHNYSYK